MKYCLLGGGGVFALHTAKLLLEKKETELVLSIGRNQIKNPAFGIGVGVNDDRYVYKPCHIVYEQDFLFEYFEKYKPDYILNFAALAYATSWEKSFRYYDTNVTHHHNFFDEEENKLIDIHQDDVDEVNIKRTIPGKKIKSVEVIAKIVSDNQSQK